MEFKYCKYLTYLLVLYCTDQLDAQINYSSNPVSSSQSFSAIEDLPGVESNKSVLVLVPKDVNITELQATNEDFNLFKLNTDGLLNSRDHEPRDETIDELAEEDVGEDETKIRSASLIVGRRESRKLNFLRGLWSSKPKTSPLYLVNGTVCRFVNSAPICTTLSTTGLLPGGSGQNRPAASGVQSGMGSSVQFDQNQNQNQNQNPNQNPNNRNPTQQPRPAAILDDDSQDINVESIANSTDDTRVVRGQPQPSNRPSNNLQAVQGSRPMNFVVSRRPLNLLSLRRPVRHYLAPGGRADESVDKSRKPQGTRGGRYSIL